MARPHLSSSNLFERLEDGLALGAVVVVEEDGDEGGGVEEALEHGAVDRLDLLVQLAVVVVDQPLEDRVLVAQVALRKRGGGKGLLRRAGDARFRDPVIVITD